MHPDLLQDEDWHIIVDLCKTVNLAMSRLLDACRVSEAMLKQANGGGEGGQVRAPQNGQRAVGGSVAAQHVVDQGR